MKNIEFKINAPKKLIVGDPWYLEAIENKTDRGCEKKITFIRKRMPSKLDWICCVKEVENEFDYENETIKYTTIIVSLIGVSTELNTETKTSIINAFKEGYYHPKLLSKQGALGCDTAEFIIETNKGYDSFHTGGDGAYGSYMTYKNNYGYNIELSFDADLFNFDDIVKRIKNLF